MMIRRLLHAIFSHSHQWEEREKNPHMDGDFGSAAVCTYPGCNAVIWDYREAEDDSLRADGGSFANADGCWICGEGDGPYDTDLTLDLGYDAHVHPECLDKHNCENIHEYETNRSVDTAVDRSRGDSGAE